MAVVDPLERRLARQEALRDIRQIVDGLQADGTHVLVLSDYEAANLRAALDAAMTVVRGPNPLAALNNGDWLNQIRLRIPETSTAPNAGAMHLIEESLRRCRL